MKKNTPQVYIKKAALEAARKYQEYCERIEEIAKDLILREFLQKSGHQVVDTRDLFTPKEIKDAHFLLRVAEKMAELSVEHFHRLRGNSVEYLYPELKNHENVWCKSGETWLIKFQGDHLFQMKNHKGLGFVARLLQKPNKPFHVLRDFYPEKLPGKDEREELYNRMSDDRLVQEERLSKIGAFRESKEKARTNLTKQIKAAIKKLKPFNPTLFKHLDAYVKTGTEMSYRPNPPVTWLVKI
ncbi:MAG: hypothetical protein AB1641_03750 [Thermodesulfobacteriota bacterium]